MAKRKYIPSRPPADVDEMRNRPGDEGKMWRLVYGDNDRHFGEICEAEAAAKQTRNPTNFTTKGP